MDDVLLNKAGIIERALQRVREEYQGHEAEFETNYTRQDAIILNLQRACEAAIDMGTRVIRIKKLGLPQSSREVFVLLEKAQFIPAELSRHMQGMVGFRNIAVHDYQAIQLAIVRHLMENRLSDFNALIQFLLKIS